MPRRLWVLGNTRMSGDQLRLSKAEFKSLMEQLNHTDGAAPKVLLRRRHKRYALPTGWTATVELQQPGGAPVKFPGVLRDISRGGISMLYIGYVHAGATIKIAFRGPDDGLNLHAEGKVVRCRHVKAHIHEIGVRFGADLPVEFLVPSDAPVKGQASEDYTRLGQFVDLIARAIKTNTPLATVRQLVDELKRDLDRCEEPAEPSERDAA